MAPFSTLLIKISLYFQSFPIKAQFEWRPLYTIDIDSDSGSSIQVTVNKPWYGDYGLYDHFHEEIQERRIRLVPNFMFGLTQEVLDQMYGDPQHIPSTGIISDSTGQ